MRKGKVRVLIAAKDRELRDHLRRLVLEFGEYEVTGSAIDGQEAVQLSVMLKPDIALVNADLPIFNGLEASEMISLAVPEVRTVLLGNGQPDAQFLQEAMKAGLRAYVPYPYDAPVLLKTLESVISINKRLDTPQYQAATDPTQIPKLIVVTGGKGGIGKTTMAASISACLAKKYKGKVVLFDLYTQFGDVSTMLDLKPQRCLSDVTAVTNEIDLETLESCMVTQEDTGLKVLVSSLIPKAIDAVSAEQVESTIYALKQGYTYIVVDLPPVLHATTLYVLANCNRLFVITNMFDLPTLRNARELLDKVVGDYVSADRVSVIANRVSKYDDLRLSDAESVLGRPFAAKVPNDRRLVKSINQGVPFMVAYSKSPMADVVESITSEIIQENSVRKD
ncbi:MAG: AAA family ATPase [bacterium]